MRAGVKSALGPSPTQDRGSFGVDDGLQRGKVQASFMESLENRRPISEQLVWAVAPTVQIICYLGYDTSLEEVTQDLKNCAQEQELCQISAPSLCTAESLIMLPVAPLSMMTLA